MNAPTFRLVCALALLTVTALATARGQTNTLVVPAEMADRYGPADLTAYRENQIIYGADLFAHASEDEIIVYGVAFRLDEKRSSLNTVVPRIEIFLSTYTRSILEARPHPVWNHGPDRLRVYHGENVLLNVSRNTSPNDFGVAFQFQQPFVYDRRSGHLVLDFNVSFGVESPLVFDVAATLANDSQLIRGAFEGYGIQELKGFLFPARFEYVPIPEPSVSALLSIWVLVCGRFWKKS